MTEPTLRELALIEAVRRAARWFHNHGSGNGVNSPNGAIFVARGLADALAQYPDVPPVSDADRSDKLS